MKFLAGVRRTHRSRGWSTRVLRQPWMRRCHAGDGHPRLPGCQEHDIRVLRLHKPSPQALSRVWLSGGSWSAGLSGRRPFHPGCTRLVSALGGMVQAAQIVWALSNLFASSACSRSVVPPLCRSADCCGHGAWQGAPAFSRLEPGWRPGTRPRHRPARGGVFRRHPVVPFLTIGQEWRTGASRQVV